MANPAEKGYIIIEALIAAVIVMVALVPIAGLYAAAIRNADHSAARTVAVFLAQERMEELKAAYDLNRNFPPEETDKPLPQNNIVFYRSDSHVPDVFGDFYTITVTVKWTNQNRNHNIVLETFIVK